MAGKHGSYTLQCDVIKSDSFSGVRCGQPARIDNAASPERATGLRSIRNWFTSTPRLMKSVQVKLQSSRLDMHFGESLLELTSVCRPQLKPGGKLSYKAQHERDRWPLWQLYSLCLPFITPAEESQSIELKRRTEKSILLFSYSCNLEAGWVPLRIRVLEERRHSKHDWKSSIGDPMARINVGNVRFYKPWICQNFTCLYVA